MKRGRKEDPTERIELAPSDMQSLEDSAVVQQAAVAKSLVAAAREVRQHAWAPYSKFKVGAAVVTDKGVFTGVNVENASYPLSVCAERNAIASAVAAGARKVLAVAIVADTPEPVSPCGGCRQVIREFGRDAILILANARGKIETTSLQALLPRAFGPEDLGVETP